MNKLSLNSRIFSIPVHPLFFAAYPVLTLFATNLIELNDDAYVRPLIISIAVGAVIFAVAAWANKNWRKGGLEASLFLILFFSYGQIYHALRDLPGIGIQVARHRFLGPIFLAVLIAGIWLIQSRVKDPVQASIGLNLVGLVLLIFPFWQIASQGVQIALNTRNTVSASQGIDPLHPPVQQDAAQQLPDIYYIILDMHTRADSMQEDYSLDETPYLQKLKDLGFYVADCSQPNYDFTQASLVAGLNYDYIPDLAHAYQALGPDANEPWILIKKSLVWRQLKAIGYKTVAFQTTYQWSTIEDADIFLGLDRDSLQMQMVTPFESMLIKSTAALVVTDSQSAFLRTQLHSINYPFSIHVDSERFILSELPKIADIPEPTFTFAHILIPHYPFVFRPDGSLQTDEGFFNGSKAGPVDKKHSVQGYSDGVEFIDNQISEISKTILAHSKIPPIIIIQGDHGYEGPNRYRILNAYYVNQKAEGDLYPSISPVNSFRVVFNNYFGMSYPLLKDYTYKSNDWEHPLQNNSSRCTSQ